MVVFYYNVSNLRHKSLVDNAIIDFLADGVVKHRDFSQRGASQIKAKNDGLVIEEALDDVELAFNDLEDVTVVLAALSVD